MSKHVFLKLVWQGTRIDGVPTWTHSVCFNLFVQICDICLLHFHFHIHMNCWNAIQDDCNLIEADHWHQNDSVLCLLGLVSFFPFARAFQGECGSATCTPATQPRRSHQITKSDSNGLRISPIAVNHEQCLELPSHTLCLQLCLRTL